MDKDLFCDCEVIHKEIVEKVERAMPPALELFELADFFKVLGNTTRAKILWALDQNEMCVCDLAALLKMSKSAISHQLRLLREKDFVRFRREGKVVFYALKDEHVSQIINQGLVHIKEDKSFSAAGKTKNRGRKNEQSNGL